ncbi:MAG: hypothetical protein GW903_08360 [Alphaproteobacteria bacterium]|nr:hypothetical protein [Alphaproteobacteria bacterium]NCQ88776.1 hypothetical protein [Alphaproteobacteria bacterium]NCT07301.1 hypothetical protein [Alphaproteobacteria bacterium]
MNKLLFLLAFILIAVAATAGPAFAYYEVKNSYYFMKDDGEFSDDEKDQEAMYVYEQCQGNALRAIYFDCACIAGAFRQIRDEDEFIRPQETILQTLFDDDSRGCVNEERIAGQAYLNCSEYAAAMRHRRKDNEEFCECVANDVARKFSDDPRLRSLHIQNLQTNAYSQCNPATREALRIIEERNAKARAK